ncbi:MAG: ABC transporter ATP-binding protein [Armatimonadetes bacterium]|nr:ABC transporter ATP-binding protein [Armatimonadota bacterium]
MSSSKEALVEIENLQISFPLEDKHVSVVNEVSFTIPRAHTVGLVGESGCGKSMTGLSLLQLITPPGQITQGKILFHATPGEMPVDIANLPPRGDAIRAIRGSEIAMIFQEPMSSLNPVYTIGNQISEMILQHNKISKKEAHNRSIEMLQKVGIPAPEIRVNDYPHQLSGGMRQRAMIAMALSCNPKLLIADEPTTALDVTVQAQIVDLLRSLQQELGMAILIISHDLGVIADLAEEVIVMYAGRVVEKGTAEEIFYTPKHPYTRGLLKSVPVLGDTSHNKLYSIPGTVPSPLAMPKGCSFRPRCSERFEKCMELPQLTTLSVAHDVRCWAREQEALPE